MTIKEMEELTGLSRSHIRFYEKEELLSPRRNPANGYREYSDEDAACIKKIACLRTLGLSVEEIRQLAEGKANLYEAIQRQDARLAKQLRELSQARSVCQRMLSEPHIDYETLDVAQYITDLDGYWQDNRASLERDLAGFWHIWKSRRVWGVLTAAALLSAAFSFGRLPDRIPVQWQGGEASTLADRRFIFAYPAACVALRFCLRPFIWRWLASHTSFPDQRAVSDGIVNALCLAALLFEFLTIFSAL